MEVSQPENEDHQPENGFVSPETPSPSLLSRIDGCVLPFLGGFGKYQKQLIVLTWIPALFIGFSQFSDNFLLAQPNNTCLQPQINTTNLTAGPTSLFNGLNNVSARATYSSASGTDNETRNVQCMCTQWSYELQTGLVQNVVTKWNLVCNSAWKVHIAKFSLLVGSIFGYLVLGVLADWFGRHPVLIVSVMFMLVFGLAVAFSVNLPMFSTLRFFEGFCLAGITLSLYVLRIELCLPGWRFSMTMVANFVVLGGQLLMPGLAAICHDWQVLQAVIISPLLFMLSYIWLFPESLRWLLATQQYCRSKWIMDRIAKKNQANMERDADELLTELHRAMQKKPKKACIVKMVGTRNLWKNIAVLCVNSLTGYGIHHCFARSMMDQEAEETTMFHNFYADYYTMAGIAVASCMALCPAVGLMGRRGGLLLFMIITALASLLQLGLLNLLGKYSVQLNIERSDTLKSNFSVAFSIIGMFSSHAVSSLSIFFCAEITPTVIRGGGLGLVLASAGFGMLTAPIMELHNQKGYFLHHVIFACCTLICIICILLLPETRYHSLPETIADGETYTRQPLLPHRKPGEQRLLLTKTENRNYAQGHDTPLHEAAATAVSTMESTASSAIDLTAPSVIDLTAPSAVDAPLDLPIQSTTCVLPLRSMKPAAPDAPNGSAETALSGSSAPDLLQTATTQSPPPSVINNIHPGKTESPATLPTNTLHPSTVETLINTDTAPPSTTESHIPTPTDPSPPLEVDAITVSVEPPDVVDSLASDSHSPVPFLNDTAFSSTADSSVPSASATSVDSPTPPVNNVLPLCTMNLPPSPVTQSTADSPTHLVNNILPPSSTDSPTHLVNDDLPLSPTESSTPPIADSPAHGPVTSPAPSALEPSPAVPPPSLSPASVTDTSTPSVAPATHPSTVDSTSTPLVQANPPSAAAADSTTSIDETAASPPVMEPTIPPVINTDLSTEAGHPITVDSTVSSPIDSGAPSVTGTILTETSTANGVASS
ncbi:solute carrier family 22 member 23 [Chanos chanos]|uniref:Solute carrier family 22 member 23-like n=1 Tax=Chanos chanos TaxID=29144 RepID=A0A6J2VED6_CHACN|nr:solute carrier family 22 member 23-like [Chanos chanos]XP_030630268.1 solute carrier family 22 member 23-like [Chanos chanos]